MNNEEICADFRRRYEGTFIQIESHDGRVKALAKLACVRSDQEKVATLELITAEFGTISTNLGSEEYLIKFDYPQAGVFQRGKDACVFVRRPERQYSRGVSAATCRASLVCHNLTGNPYSIDFFTLRAAFEHKVVTFSKGMELLSGSKHRSVALENNFSVVLPFSKWNHYTMYHLDTPVALVSKEGKLVSVMEPIYQRAIGEVLRG